MKTVNLGLIGAGRMGTAHFTELAKIEGVKLAGVYDIKPEAAKACNEKFGAAICGSAEELANLPGLDGVLVCTPTPCHVEGVMAALKAKKAIFCEKPLCRNAKDAKKLLKAGSASKKPFAVGFVRRYQPQTLELKKLLESGVIGKVRFCNVQLPLGLYKRMPGDWFADYSACGGVILDMLAHHIDLTNWFFGKPANVFAASLMMDRSQPEPADYAASVVNYANGVICNFSSCWWRSGRTGELMEIYGDNGSLSVDGSAKVTHYPKGGEMQTIQAPGESGNFRQMQALVESIRTGVAPTASLQDGYNSLELALAMIKSAESGKAVRL